MTMATPQKSEKSQTTLVQVIMQAGLLNQVRMRMQLIRDIFQRRN